MLAVVVVSVFGCVIRIHLFVARDRLVRYQSTVATDNRLQWIRTSIPAANEFKMGLVAKVAWRRSRRSFSCDRITHCSSLPVEQAVGCRQFRANCGSGPGSKSEISAGAVFEQGRRHESPIATERPKSEGNFRNIYIYIYAAYGHSRFFKLSLKTDRQSPPQPQI